MLQLGTTKGIKVYLGEQEGMNRHVTIWGKSGSGKSVAMQTIALRILENKGTVLAFDLHGTMSGKNIFAPLQEKLANLTNNVEAYERGIPANLFAPAIFEDGGVERPEDTVSAFCDVIEKTVSFGVRQRAALQRAARYVLDEGLYPPKGLSALDEGLRLQKTEVATNVTEKLQFILGRNVFRDGEIDKLIEQGKLNVVRLSKFDDKTQALTSELLLAYIWRRVLSGEIKDLYIMIDEFQNISLKKGSALEKFLVEGRKYGIGLILATQALGINFTNSQQKLLLQSGIQLYFKPAENEIRDVAKILGGTEIAAYSMLLSRLDIGECVALGPIQIGETGTLVSSSPTKLKITV